MEKIARLHQISTCVMCALTVLGAFAEEKWADVLVSREGVRIERWHAPASGVGAWTFAGVFADGAAVTGMQVTGLAASRVASFRRTIRSRVRATSTAMACLIWSSAPWTVSSII